MATKYLGFRNKNANYYGLTKLRERGWTRTMVDKFRKIKKVERIEAKPEFVQYKAKSEIRRAKINGKINVAG